VRFLFGLCASAAFLGAALLFVVQPLLGKWLLPWFGGSPSTWAACMVFFQGMLLVGYGYVHELAGRVAQRTQLVVHACVVLLAVCAAASTRTLHAPPSQGAPVLQIAALLLLQIGASYFVLATTAPLVQRWAAVALQREPYGLYALSNAGSLLGLLAYPFAIEPRASLQTQFSLWTYGFFAYAALLLAALVCVRALVPTEPTGTLNRDTPTGDEPCNRSRLRWIACAFLPSVLLLAVTNHITVDIASIPLLWIAPLALYLITFIVAFSRFIARLRWLALLSWIAAAIGIGFGSFAQGSASLAQQLATPCLGLFAAGLLCHGELSRTRPDPAHLTQYYLLIALGGALGSISVSWLAPLIFNDTYELELGTLAVFALLVLVSRAWPPAQQRTLYIGIGVCGPLLLTSLAMRARDDGAQGHVVERRRSFLGPLRVVDSAAGRILTHGRVRHGLQLRDAPQQPTMYFAAGTAIARVMTEHATDRKRSIGVVGLGVGTLASYARPGDRIRFYELDQNAIELANERFTFLHDSVGHVELALGDGRLTLDREPAQHFDILVLDAFSSDSVPVHLLTREAFAIYARHLAPDGVFLANVSNRHLAVDRAVRASAAAQHFACEVVQSEPNAALHRDLVRWAVMTRDSAQLAAVLEGLPTLERHDPDVPFTDTQASLLSIVR